MKIRIVANGEYPKELPEALAKALAFEIQRHMEGYGLKDCRVNVGPDHWRCVAK
jgi:hypothetical protein